MAATWRGNSMGAHFSTFINIFHIQHFFLACSFYPPRKIQDFSGCQTWQVKYCSRNPFFLLWHSALFAIYAKYQSVHHQFTHRIVMGGAPFGGKRQKSMKNLEHAKTFQKHGKVFQHFWVEFFFLIVILDFFLNCHLPILLTSQGFTPPN